MEIRKISILLTIFIGGILALPGCKKDDGAIPKRVTISDVPTITTNIDATGSQAIDLLNLTSFSGKFKVDLYFPGTTAPSKVDIVVRKNGSNGNVKIYKAGVTSFPSSYTVTAAEIATLFGVAVALGDSYDFAPDIYVGDKKYEAFPAVGTGTGAGVIGQPLFSEFARFGAICAYDPNIYQGNFVVVSDAFQDLNPGDIVTLAKISNNSFSFTYPDPGIVPFPPPAIAVVVNTGNNNLTVASQVLGTKIYGTYDNPTVAATTGSVSPCSQTVTINLVWTVKQGSFGTNPLVLKKQ